MKLKNVILIVSIVVNEALTSTCSFWSGFGNCYAI